MQSLGKLISNLYIGAVQQKIESGKIGFSF